MWLIRIVCFFFAWIGAMACFISGVGLLMYSPVWIVLCIMVPIQLLLGNSFDPEYPRILAVLCITFVIGVIDLTLFGAIIDTHNWGD